MNIHLHKHAFASRELLVLEHGAIQISSFRFDSGVEALRVRCQRGEAVVLPFQGHQIWSVKFDGRELAMKSTFNEPHPTLEYLRTYGAFALHCGATGMGRPGPTDSHSLHGELPNAPYDDCIVKAGTSDDGDACVDIVGNYWHRDAFRAHYRARATVRIWGRRACVGMQMEITNHRSATLELMYMAHLNFRPVNHGRLVASALLDTANVAFRQPLPQVQRSSAHDAFLAKLRSEPSLLGTLRPEYPFDPEVVCTLNYLGDLNGIAHTLQIHPNGTADFVRHRPAELPIATRWIVRNGDEDALGMVLPGTAGPEGYTVEREKGRIVSVAPNETRTFRVEAGVLTKMEAEQVEAAIGRIVA